MELLRLLTACCKLPLADFTEIIPSPPHNRLQMSVVANGLGSILHVQFPARTALHGEPSPRPAAPIVCANHAETLRWRVARSDAILAHSDKVKISSSLFGNPFGALARRMGGGPLLLNTIKTLNHTGDALLTPPHFGDLAVLQLVSSHRGGMLARADVACVLAGWQPSLLRASGLLAGLLPDPVGRGKLEALCPFHGYGSADSRFGWRG